DESLITDATAEHGEEADPQVEWEAAKAARQARTTAWRRGITAGVGRELRRRPPEDEQDALAAGFAAAGGFATAALAGAVASSIWLMAAASDLPRPGGMLVARPSVAGTLGLAFVWGLAGGLGAALVAAGRRHPRGDVGGPRWGGGPAVA
ncbi:MAG TPA: hypothetical protein VE760_01870, partial [Acidimicrobiales bacterium]|nr:hypothetical protein [Acidimicrobiales bacterium]